MSILSIVSGIFSGGTVKSIENIAKEWIETDIEQAEAKALMVKTLDPNGLMRRNLSARVTTLYTIYIITTLLLIIADAFGIGNASDVATASTNITELFIPITSMFSLVLSASFGVNYANIKSSK